jgi:hypothetical protein
MWCRVVLVKTDISEERIVSNVPSSPNITTLMVEAISSIEM